MDKPQRGRGGRPKAPPPYSPPTDLDVGAALAALQKAEENVREAERQVWVSETRLLERQNPRANALTGYEGLLSGAPPISRTDPIKPEERIFSGSSVRQPKKENKQ